MKKLPFISDEGIEKVLNIFKNAFLNNGYYGFYFNLNSINPNIDIFNESLMSACTTTSYEERKGNSFLYLTKKQVKRVNDFLHQLKKGNTLTLLDVLDRSGEKEKKSDLYKFISGIDNENIDYVNLQNVAIKFFQNNESFIDIEPDSTYCQWGRSEVASPYVDKKSLEPLYIIAGNSEELINSADEVEKERLEKLVEDINKRIEDGKKIQAKNLLQQRFKSIFDFLSNSSALSIAYDSNVNSYIYGMISCLDLQKRIKPFCKIIDYELIDDDGENVIANITVKSKKEEIKYQVYWRYTFDNTYLRLLIDANSIDINKAIVIK